jgi:pectate lyase
MAARTPRIGFFGVEVPMKGPTTSLWPRAQPPLVAVASLRSTVRPLPSRPAPAAAARLRAAARLAPLLLPLLAPLLPSAAAAQGLPAFPGAQGFGAKASGGRGGQVLRVTTLSASGSVAGSLQWALNQPGPRIIVFRVSGVIVGDVNIPDGDVTIAGQTAPGAGITINGHLYTDYGDDTHNIVIRHLRVRPPNPDAQWPASQHDAIQLSTAHTFILDHVSASHGADETIDCWGGAHDFTLQWSAVTYPIYDPANGWTHNTGIINHRPCIDDGVCTAADALGGRVSIHHDLFAHARNRTPALSTGPAEVIDNVVYNGREGFVHHNIVGAASASATTIGDFNIVGNWYIDGPSASLAPLWFDPENASAPIPSRYFVADNWVEDPGVFNGRFDNPFTTAGFEDGYGFYCCGITSSQFGAGAAFDFSGYASHVPVTVDPGTGLVAKVAASAGAFPRDVVDRWAVDDLNTRTGAWGNRRSASWLEGLTPGSPPVDADADGMADAWETTHGLDPADGSDHATVRPSGYTAIEEYINGVADGLVVGLVFADGFEGGLGAWSAVRSGS